MTGGGASTPKLWRLLTPPSFLPLRGCDAVTGDDVLLEARRLMRCAECGEPLHHRVHPRTPFCTAKCRYRWRDRRRYAVTAEAQRERSRVYYREHRDEILEKAAAKRGRLRPPERTSCDECGEPLPVGRRVVCSKRCGERRFKRLHPVEYAERERRKVERRRERRREARKAAGSPSADGCTVGLS
jgi:endogenous inhibitor of DNA gyrase (YacG/DUF329 family)